MGNNILFLLNDTGLMDKDMAHGFKQAGMNLCVEVLTIGKTQEGHAVQLFSIRKLTRILERFKPDIVFSFNGYGLDNEGALANEYSRRGIPFVTWFVDKPRSSELGHSFVKPNTFSFVFDRTYISILREAGFDNVFYLPLATNPDRFRPVNGVLGKRDVCFVGGSDYGKIRYLARNLDNMVGKIDERLFEAIEVAINGQMEAMDEDTWVVTGKALDSYGIYYNNYPDILKDMLEGFVEREASLRVRLRVIQEISSNFDMAVYGDSLWRKVVGDKYRGRVNYFNDDIVKVYNMHPVHVNISKFQLRTAINQRPFDISACGGFVLSDERSELRDMFEEDEIISYNSIEDLIDKVGYYLNNDIKRDEIAKKARCKVLREHTYLHRSEEIVGRVMGY